MSGKTIDLVSDSEVETTSSFTTETSLDSHLPSFDNDHLEPEVITLFDDYDLERVVRNFSEGETSYSQSLDALILNVDERINHVDVTIPLASCRKRMYYPI